MTCCLYLHIGLLRHGIRDIIGPSIEVLAVNMSSSDIDIFRLLLVRTETTMTTMSIHHQLNIDEE